MLNDATKVSHTGGHFISAQQQEQERELSSQVHLLCIHQSKCVREKKWAHKISHTVTLLTAQLDELVRMKLPHIPSNIKNECHQVKGELAGSYTEVASVVKRYSGTQIPLIKPKGYSVRVCGQDGTVYAGNEDQLEAWKDFYLPERMEMVVIGAIDDFPCDAFGLQLVLLLCEDGNIYAYEDEVLHLVARSVKELFETGLTFPGLECYKLGECFEDYTEEEYNEIMESDDVKEMKEAHEKLRESLELELLESLKEFKSSQFKGVEEGIVQPKKNSDTVIECREIVVRNHIVPSCTKLLIIK
ncbi:uncharacterized protein LOC108272891 [Ictalurus punctatus]|uniref:Uncharacterized protein LOC108272891 n=1 Tax=Ictalurus punctatus TaxID=7998 RepID=A0A2D0S372_ICTPU|nr:uncharacterized protein LOC108272891 [Ictalurus punctatus]